MDQLNDAINDIPSIINPVSGAMIKWENSPPRLVYFTIHEATTNQTDNFLTSGTNVQHTTVSAASSSVNAMYAGIIGRQCWRARDFIASELSKLEWEDEGENEKIVNRIAEAIDLIGEPGIYASCEQLLTNRTRHFTFSSLLRALSVAKDRSTEGYRVKLLLLLLRDADPATRYSAVEALGNMAIHSDSAKFALRDFSSKEPNSEIAAMADAYSR
jgi:hypothetical protein